MTDTEFEAVCWLFVYENHPEPVIRAEAERRLDNLRVQLIMAQSLADLREAGLKKNPPPQPRRLRSRPK
jgi:hypothetical protein